MNLFRHKSLTTLRLGETPRSGIAGSKGANFSQVLGGLERFCQALLARRDGGTCLRLCPHRGLFGSGACAGERVWVSRDVVGGAGHPCCWGGGWKVLLPVGAGRRVQDQGLSHFAVVDKLRAAGELRARLLPVVQ